MADSPTDLQIRIMPSGEGRWYWEVVCAHDVIARGVAETEPAACQEAHGAAQKANLVEKSAPW